MPPEDPDQLVMEIRRIQQSLTQLQHQVIRGEIKPADYQRIERERVEEIHQLEERLARLAGGEPVPDRKTDL